MKIISNVIWGSDIRIRNGLCTVACKDGLDGIGGLEREGDERWWKMG